MSTTAKVIELVGNSNESWEDAAQTALNDADETLEDISGIKIVSQTATVENGQIDQYKTVLHVSFQLKR
ncbi:dodecin family protein [Halobaculum rarum]|uniref:dodecin family protein n=1 Tax=Halobaculum rarum TaxID=3075122 RepID=UPI0032AF1346